jgi:PAS domain S-box-containing protein
MLPLRWLRRQSPGQAVGATWAWRPLGVAVALSAGVDLAVTVAGWGAIRSPALMGLSVTGGNVVILVGFAVLAARMSVRSESRQQAAEFQTESSHLQLQSLIDNTSAVIYMKRIDNGRYLLVNREWERLFKVTRDKVIDLADHEIFPSILAAELRGNDLYVAQEGKTVQFEESADTDDGPHTYVSVKFPVIDTTGRPYAVCGISTDITDWKRAEERINQLNEDLEGRVLERTSELEASTHELDAFAYSVSHDLRAPLRSLHGFSQALLADYAGVLDDTGKDYLHRLQRNVRRMGEMIDSLLTLSRATRVELARHPVDLTALAREVTAELRAGNASREVTVDIAGDLHGVGDPQLLRLVMQNLLANAWKFSAKTAGARIEVGQQQRGGEHVFFVRDNGAGFDMRYAGKLFSAFQRLHAAAEFEGTGIGLATVQRIILRHGGRVFAEAEPGKGAAFYFTLRPAAGRLEARQEHSAGQDLAAADHQRSSPAPVGARGTGDG